MASRAKTASSTSRPWSRFGALCGVLFGLAACGGGGIVGGSSTASGSGSNALPNVAAAPGTSAPAAISTAAAVTTPQNTNPTPAPQAVTVHATYMLPASLTSSSATHVLAVQSVTHRQLQYVSPSNTSVSIAVTPTGGATSTYGPSACTSVSCAISFTATPGPTTLTFTLTNGSAQTLSTFSTLAIIQPNTVNTLNFTANPVVSSVTLQLASASINAGTPANVALTVNALDASGNTIVGNGNYVDVNGSPVSIMLSTTNSQNGGRGTASIQGPPRVTAPDQAAIKLHYDGNWLDHTTVTATATSSAVNMSGATATLTTVPYSIYLSYVSNTPSHNFTANGLSGITQGSDGNLWVTENGYGLTVGCIAKVTTAGVITEYCAGLTGISVPNYITLGPDGNLWFTEQGTNRFGHITTSGSVQEFSGLTGTAPSAIVTGPDGNLWIAEAGGSKIARVTTQGRILSEYATAGNNISGMTVGNDGKLWLTSLGAGLVSNITTAGQEKDFTYSDTPVVGHTNQNIVKGPDNNIWFVEEDQQTIGRITPAGSFTSFSTGISASAGIAGITAGPDGNLWFTEWGNDRHIGRITTSGVVTEYLINSYAQPDGITVGPDGNIWFTEYNGNVIVKFVL